MIANIWKLSKLGWHIFLNGTGEQQLIAGLAIGAIVGLERAAIVIGKSKKETKELEKRYQQLKAESDRLCKQAEEDFSEIKRMKEKEMAEAVEKMRKELEEAKKNDPMKKQMERLIRKANALTQED